MFVKHIEKEGQNVSMVKNEEWYTQTLNWLSKIKQKRFALLNIRQWRK